MAIHRCLQFAAGQAYAEFTYNDSAEGWITSLTLVNNSLDPVWMEAQRGNRTYGTTVPAQDSVTYNIPGRRLGWYRWDQDELGRDQLLVDGLQLRGRYPA